MRPFLIAAALLSPLAASASIEIQLSSARESVSIGPDDCGSNIPVTFTTAVGLVTFCEDMKFWLTEADCSNAPATGEKVVHTVPQGEILTTTTGNFTVAVSDLPGFNTADGGAACGVDQVERTFKLCGAVQYQNQLSECTLYFRESTPPSIHYDSQPPQTPTITTVEPLDSALGVGVAVEDGTSSVTVVARIPGTTDAVVTTEKSAPVGVVRVTGLTNGTEYELVARARDEAGNVSDFSEPALGTPVKIAGFGTIYKGMGGKEEGGCSAVGAGTAGIWGLVFGGWFLWRRRSWR